MTLLEAYKITKSFKTYFRKEKPFLTSEVLLIKKDNYGRTIHYYWVLNPDGNRIKQIMSKNKYDSYNIKEISDPKYTMLMKEIEANMFLTSVGLVIEEDFYLAEDIMENTEFLKRKDLEIDSVYLDIKGREFLYTGDLIINPGKRETLYKSQLFDLKKELFIHFTSIKLVEFSYKYKKTININHSIKSESKRLK